MGYEKNDGVLVVDDLDDIKNYLFTPYLKEDGFQWKSESDYFTSIKKWEDFRKEKIKFKNSGLGIFTFNSDEGTEHNYLENQDIYNGKVFSIDHIDKTVYFLKVVGEYEEDGIVDYDIEYVYSIKDL